MKYLILVPDGAADDPINMLKGKTPLEVAHMPGINALAARGQVGTVKTIPDGIDPGSDAANLSVMGYDPCTCLTGRSPLEAASIGIQMSETDVAFRTNLITLSGTGTYEDLIIQDHSAGDISTEEAGQLIYAINQAFADDKLKFHTGVSYRHCLMIHHGQTHYDLTPPHDILTKAAGGFLPKGDGSQFITDMMKQSYEILKDHPVNQARIAKGLNLANSIWIWGQGKKPNLSLFYDKYKLKGAAISAVDLIKGIAICAGLNSIDVEGATGTIHTNYTGKTQAAIDAFARGTDFVYIHLEGPDECSHQGDVEGKVKCMELIDQKVLSPILEYLRKGDQPFRILVVPDHRTPISIRTHDEVPVPYVFYDSQTEQAPDQKKVFSEMSGKLGVHFQSGVQLADFFFEA